MTTFHTRAFAIAGLLACSSVVAHAGTCGHAYLVEGQPPSAFAGITTAGSFSSYFWAWGAEAWDQGSWTAPQVNDGTGVAVNPGILWANSDACGGTVAGTGLLVEARTAASGGLFAVVAVLGAEVDLDAVQGSVQSVAQPLPATATTTYVNGSDGYGDYADVGLAWTAPSASAWALSDVGTVLAGYAVYAVTASGGGPVNTGDRSLFTRVGGTPTAPAPYITDDADGADGLLPATQTSCVVRVREGALYYFALSVIVDGSGAASEPQADASAVETANVGACSAAVNADVTIFADGFEGGSTSAWSTAVP